jgi:hypothetical protein
MRTSRVPHLYTRLAHAVARQVQQHRRSPDAGLETVDKILWAAGIIVIAGGVIGIFSSQIQAYAQSVLGTLGL